MTNTEIQNYVHMALLRLNALFVAFLVLWREGGGAGPCVSNSIIHAPLLVQAFTSIQVHVPHGGDTCSDQRKHNQNTVPPRGDLKSVCLFVCLECHSPLYRRYTLYSRIGVLGWYNYQVPCIKTPMDGYHKLPASISFRFELFRNVTEISAKT